MQDAENKCGEQAGKEGEVTSIMIKELVMQQLKKLWALDSLDNILKTVKQIIQNKSLLAKFICFQGNF